MLACAMTKPKDSSSPFAALDALRAKLPPGPPKEPPKPIEKKPPPRAVIRYERKGRGGKEVTVVDKLELKAAMGCGGFVDGETIVLQGDLRTRLPAALTAKGIAKITVS
ncbi:MAG: translation initiation factor [Deltaproteobacteria bacterium]|nr:translation initiation factor [Deltaproteobacteria bacterium]